MNRAIASLVCLVLPVAATAAEPQVDYASQVKPILAKYCYECHGAQLSESDLRLDTAAAALEGGTRGTAVVPGESGKSRLYQAVSGANEDLVMPPEEPRLKAEEVAILKAWIDQGAKAPEGEIGEEDPRRQHWSFQPVERPKLPEVNSEAWCRNGIDYFVLARLEKEGIEPSPRADRVTLIRRLSLDLLGLPPTVEEVDRFLADESPGAYERLVDRLLDSPHFGERWGRHWLDLARYADSNGFTIDSAREIWLYRDWVIDALNRDLPFDRFTIEQFAGDMLPEATRQQIVATGFHRNTLINEEGGTDDEQFRVESVVDRVNTTGAVFLGLTIGCAQCHNHKYDPLTQRDYYRMYAFLNNCDEPRLNVPTPQQKEQLDALDRQVAEARKRLAERDKELAEKQQAWERTLAGLQTPQWQVVEPVEFRSEGGASMEKLDDDSILVGGDVPGNDTYTVVVEAPAGPVTAVRLEALTHDSLPKGGPGLAANGNFVLTKVELAADDKAVPLAKATADYSQENLTVDGTLDDDPATGWGIYGKTSADHQAVFVTADEAKTAAGARLVFTFKHESKYQTYHLGRFRLALTTAPREALEAPAELAKAAAVPAEKRTKEQQQKLDAAFQATDEERKKLAAELKAVTDKKSALAKQIPSTLVMRQRSSPRETHVHLRGNFLSQGDRVYPDVPEVLPGLPDDLENPTRLDLAKWLVDPENPLTPRVTVNRQWQRLFGRGIVSTENDFGTRGAEPTHPELLDWLASEFVRRGWSVKSMLKLMVTSATYQQSSHLRPELDTMDPANELLARQNRLRLEAEIVRDVALAASGLLSREVGGPSVYPPQPSGLDRFTQNRKNWKADQGADRYRRGMYTFFWRSSPHAFLMTFDAPDANAACTRRVRSNTPLQALTLANDEAFVEFAQGLAARVLRDGPEDARERLVYAFRTCFSREPGPRELERLADFYDAQLSQFRQSPKEAAALAPGGLPEGADPAEAAAWTAVARVLMNLDEFITRE